MLYIHLAYVQYVPYNSSMAGFLTVGKHMTVFKDETRDAGRVGPLLGNGWYGNIQTFEDGALETACGGRLLPRQLGSLYGLHEHAWVIAHIHTRIMHTHTHTHTIDYVHTHCSERHSQT